jgi:flagellar motor switch/type III secretory pathway protein FliN
METLDTKEGALEFALGSGWLSRYEASRLAPGSILRTTRIAGTGYELRFNGERIADAQAVVAGDGKRARLCAQIESLERGPGIAPEPARGTSLTELLPFTVLLGSAAASLAGLAGLGRTSIVDLGIGATEPQLAELRVAGMPAAAGRIAVCGENMCFRVVERLAGFSSDAPFRTTGSLIDPARSPQAVKDYDFRMPDCFTRVQLEAFAALHQDFLRSLGALAAGRKGFPAGMELASVDQLNFTEFAESLEEGELIVAAPCSASVRPRVPESERPAMAFLDLSGDPAFPPEAAAGWALATQARPQGGAVLAAGEILATERDIVFAALRDAWKGYGALSPFPDAEFKRAKDKPALALESYAGEWEMVALASIKLGAAGRLDIAYPLRAIEAALKALSA